MATGNSGSVEFTTNFGGGQSTLRVDWQETYSGNVSSVNITHVWFTSTMWRTYEWNANFKLKINGVDCLSLDDTWKVTVPSNGNITEIKKNGASATGTPVTGIEHNPDGTKSVNITLHVNSLSYPGLHTGYWDSGFNTQTWVTVPVKFTNGDSKPITLKKLPVGTLTISAGSHTSVVVKRSGSTLSTGADLFYGDVLTITAYVNNGYSLTSLKANTTNVVSGGTYTVTGNTTVTSSATAMSPSTLTVSGNTMGQPIVLSVNRANSSFTHEISWSFAGQSDDITNGKESTLSYSWTPNANTFGGYIPNASSGTMTFSIKTYNGNNQVGATQTTSITLNIPNDAAPTVDDGFAQVSYVNLNPDIPSSYHFGIKGYSNTAFQILDVSKIHTKYGSTLSSVSATYGGVTRSGTTPAKYGLGVATSTNIVLVLVITDSRGLQTSVTLTGTYKDYSDPTFGNVDVFRCDSTGTAKDDGTYISVTADLVYSGKGDWQDAPVDFAAEVKQVGGSYGTPHALSDGTEDHWGTFLAAKSYIVKLSFTDSFGNQVTVERMIPTASVSFNISKGGNGAAFGKYTDYDNVLDIGNWTAIGRVFGLGQARASIPENAYFRDYTDPGIYAVLDNATAQSIADCPSSVAGTLRVWIGNGNAKNPGDSAYYLLQEYMDYNGVLYRRKGQTSGGGTTIIWSSWDWYPAIILDERTITTDGSGYYQFTTDYPRDNYMIVSIHTVNSSDTFVRVTGSGGATGQWVRVLRADGSALGSTSVKLRTVFIHL